MFQYLYVKDSLYTFVFCIDLVVCWRTEMRAKQLSAAGSVPELGAHKRWVLSYIANGRERLSLTTYGGPKTTPRHALLSSL